MRSETNKIKLIVDELLTNSIDADATDVDINVSRTEDEIIIKIVDNGAGMTSKDLENARKLLQQPFRKDMEEYYGQLAGMESPRGGLNIVGMQVNHAEIESTEGEGTTVIVRRNRKM